MDLKIWQDFIDHLNASFFDFDQERYLLERSMELSSTEFMDINRQFEQAESIAHIGHWSYRSLEDKIFWSKQMFSIFGRDERIILPNYRQFLEIIHEDDRDKLNTLVEAALINGESYNLELRIYFQTDQSIRWVFIKGIGTLIEQAENTTKPYKYNLSGIVMDINDRIQFEEKLNKLNARLISVSRLAGMSEVAASVLHNIGNILNSANVSIVMLRELLSNTQMAKLENIATMLQNGIANNPEYLLSDDKGKLIPSYLSKLSQTMATNKNEMIDELDGLNKHLDHIKDIVFMQNEISGISAVKEKITTEEICNQAIQMSHRDEESTIKIKKQIEFKDNVFVDKVKMLQIIVNLILNAKDALTAHETIEQKIINILVRECKKGVVEIQISDNGVGIKQEYLNQIFSMGFTTKRDGHGFGLHMSAIAAREMGGELAVTSQGENQGATFTFTFPIKYNGGGE